MFKQAIVYYPTDEKTMAQLGKEIAAFRRTAAVRYVELLHMSESEVSDLFDRVSADVSHRRI